MYIKAAVAILVVLAATYVPKMVFSPEDVVRNTRDAVQEPFVKGQQERVDLYDCILENCDIVSQ